MSTARATSAKARELQARNAAAKRWDHPNKDAIAREYAEQRLVEFVTKVVAEAPPLTSAQRDRIAALLRAGSASPPTPSPRPGSGGTTSPSKNLRKAVVDERIAELDGVGR